MGLRSRLLNALDGFLRTDSLHVGGSALGVDALTLRTLEALLDTKKALAASQSRCEALELDLAERTLALDTACDKLDELEAAGEYCALVRELLVDVGGFNGPMTREAQMEFLRDALEQHAAAPHSNGNGSDLFKT